MSGKQGNIKGTALEEVLRAYFLRAGFFVVRGVPFSIEGEDLTDVDLWLYERPTGTTRRVQIVDVKAKSKPKAVERLFWAKGVAHALDVDGAYVATTDKRQCLRQIASKLDLVLIDGTDLQRIRDSSHVDVTERMTDEDLIKELSAVDKQRKNKELQNTRLAILATLSSGFGPSSVARSLDLFQCLAATTVSSYPNSEGAIASGRLAYLASAIVCESLDYVSVAAPFRAVEERRELMLNAVRYGAIGRENGRRTLSLAIELVRKYAPGGSSLAKTVESGLEADLNAIPAEIIADQAARMLKDGQLFSVGRELEQAAYLQPCPTFDALSTGAKSFFGALLDYANVRRETFAAAWSVKAPRKKIKKQSQNASDGDQKSFFVEGAE